MADNVTLNSGTGGETCATDDCAGVQYQVIKLADGTADSTTRVAAGGGVEANALRVTLASDSTGVVSVDDNGASLTVDNGGTFAVQAAQSGAWNVTNVSGTVSLPTGAATAAKQPALGTAGTASADVISVQGIASMTPIQVADNGAALTVDNGGTFAVQVTSIAAGDNNIGNVDIASIAAGDNNIGNVDVVTLPNVTLAAGTNTNEVVGDAAHDAAIAGNPIRIAGRALTADYTAVAAGDTADVVTTTLGKQVVYPFALPGASWSYASPAAVTDTADDAALAAVASTRHYITGVQVFNGHDTVGTEVVIKDGATVLWRGWAEQTGGGCSAQFNPPLRGTANTAVNVANITTGSSTYFNLQGFSATE